MSEKKPDKDEKPAPVVERAAPRSAPAPTVLGRLVGATVALPAAAGVFVIGSLAGIPGSTALFRGVLWGIGLGVCTSLAVRLLFSYVIRDWRRARAARGEEAS